MNRKQKYPDTKTFHFYNANPKGNYACDCVVRAICKANGKTYNKTFRELFELAIKLGYIPTEKNTYGAYLEAEGWKKMPQPKKANGKKYTGKQFCEAIQKGEFPNTDIIAHIGGHHIVAIADGKVFDTWDSTGYCIGNYWVKA